MKSCEMARMTGSQKRRVAGEEVPAWLVTEAISNALLNHALKGDGTRLPTPAEVSKELGLIWPTYKSTPHPKNRVRAKKRDPLADYHQQEEKWKKLAAERLHKKEAMLNAIS